MASETFDAVLAEMRQLAQRRREEDGDITAYEVEDFADRLAAAHAAEVAERDRMVGEQLAIAERAKAEALRQQQERIAAHCRAEAAERDATLRELLFDSYAVYAALTDDAKLRTGPENVADALDAMNRAVRERAAIDAAIATKDSAHED